MSNVTVPPGRRYVIQEYAHKIEGDARYKEELRARAIGAPKSATRVPAELWRNRAFWLKILIKRALNLGFAFRCPVCNSRIRSLRDGGEKHETMQSLRVTGYGPHPRSKCPVCFGRDRHRLLALALRRERVYRAPIARILHFAPEYYIGSELQLRHGRRYVPGDLSPGKYPHVHSVQVTDLTALDFPDADFSHVICSHVLEHVPDDAVAMREIYRVLQPGGVAFIQVPLAYGLEKTDENPAWTSRQDRTKHFGQHDHVRLYAMDIVERLTAAGFKVDVWKAEDFGPDAAQFNVIDPDEVVFVARKPSAAMRVVREAA